MCKEQDDKKMAANVGSHSPTATNSRNEKVFDDAQFTGVINLSGRKLRDFPQCCNKFDLADTVCADLSKNRYAEVPWEIAKYESLEQLNCYNNVIKSIPEAIVQLQALVHLNLGRNMLTTLPPYLCSLQSLEVLMAPNNKLVSLPEEISQLDRLMELDVSCNEITHLPTQIGDLKSLRSLNVRRNHLVELPNSIGRLKLNKLDFSSNKITHIPCDVHAMDTLQELRLDHNPLTCPPAHLCTKGLVHIKKYLFIQALKEDRKRGLLSDVQLRKNYRKSAPGQNLGSPRDRRKRNMVDSGYNTTDSADKTRWSPSEHEAQTMHTLTRAMLTLQGQPLLSVTGSDLEESNNLALRAAESVKEQRLERENQRRMFREPQSLVQNSANKPTPLSPTRQFSVGPGPKPGGPPARQLSGPASLNLHIEHQASDSSSALDSSPALASTPTSEHNGFSSKESTPTNASPPDSFLSNSGTSLPSSPARSQSMDEFTRELQRQKSEYEARKKRAEQLRLEREDKEQVERRQRESVNSSVASSLSNTSISSSGTDQDSSHSRTTRIPQSNSFREERKSEHVPYRRTVSDTHYNVRYPYTGPQGASRRVDGSPGSDMEGLHQHDNGLLDQSPVMNHLDQTPPRVNDQTPPRANDQSAPRVHYIPVIHDTSSSPSSSQHEDEFRRRHEAMINQQRQEAQMITRRLEQQKQHILRMQKDMVAKVKWGGGGGMQVSPPKIEESEEYSFSRDSTPNSSFNGSALNNHKTALPPRCQMVLEALGPELNNMNPAFTIRRNLQHAQDELQQIDQLRRTIESRLKVKLPENLPGALKDGVVLCHLANHIRPRSVSSIHVPSPAVPKLPVAKCRRNVENFLEACRRIGVDQADLFPPMDILDERGILDVAYTVQALMNLVHDPKPSAV